MTVLRRVVVVTGERLLPALARLDCGHERWLPEDWTEGQHLECHDCRITYVRESEGER